MLPVANFSLMGGTEDRRPMTEEAGHDGIKPGIKQIYRFTGTIADIHNKLCPDDLWVRQTFT